jgi:hypothetical protein
MRRPLALAAIASLAAPALAAAQEAEPDPAARQHAAVERHQRTVENLRWVDFLGAWERADGPGRARALEVLESLRQAGAGSVAPPSFEALARARRALEREPDPAQERSDLRRLADALDLIAVPGAFEPAAEGPGQALTVLVRHLYRTGPHAGVELSLVWIAPSGEEHAARREPVEAAALEGDPFPMYLRAPLSEPGLWQLVPVVERDGVALRGSSVPVECVERFGGRLDGALERARNPETPEGRLALALADLRLLGARTLAALRPSEALELLERPSEARAAALPAPLQPCFTDGQGRICWAWSINGVERPERVVVLLAPPGEPADAILAGAPGAAWRAFAREHSARVVSAQLPPLGPEHGAAEIAELFARLRGGSSAPLLVVARGDTLGRLQLGLLGEERPPFELLAASTILGARPEEVFASVPRLFVALGGAAELPESAGGAEAARELTWIDGSPIPLCDELRLPRLVSSWLEQRATSGAR